MKRIRGTSFLCASLYLAGCGSGPQLGRIGHPVPLTSGGPRSSCEREGWYEVVPTRISTHTMRGAGRYHQHHYWQLHEGLGVYRAQHEDPEDLEDVWPALQEPQLYRAHQARIQPVDDASRAATWWAVGGLVGMGVGLGTAAAIENESKTAAAVAGISGLAIGLVGIVGTLVTMPSAHDELAADARRQLFFPQEDDLKAVVRGVDRSNARRRTVCGGNPVPPAQLVAAPPPSPAFEPAK